MSESKHTPGPWVVGMRNGYNPNTVFSEGDNGIASVFGVPMHCHIDDLTHIRDVQPLANARLIAAAPDMLEALKQVMGWIDGWSPTFTQDEEWPEAEHYIRAAISKAEGQS